MPTEIVVVAVGVNGAIALTCGFCTWKLLQFRNRLLEWERQINALEQDLVATLTSASLNLRQGRQQLQYGRRQVAQLQTTVQAYRQWTLALINLLQWTRSLNLWTRPS